MSAPTARECIQELIPPPEHVKRTAAGYTGYATLLAARVEKVLALKRKQEDVLGLIPQTAAFNWNRCFDTVLSILDGGGA